MSQPTISFRYSAGSGYDDSVTVYLDDMTEEQQNDDSGEAWGTMIVNWSYGTTIRVDLAGYSPAEAAGMVDNVNGVVEDWLNYMASGSLDWDMQDFITPNEDVEDSMLVELHYPLMTEEEALAAYLDESDMLSVPEHLDRYRGVIYERMSDDMIANGEVIITNNVIFHNV